MAPSPAAVAELRAASMRLGGRLLWDGLDLSAPARPRC
jgi:hypothetical protein